MVRFPQGSGTPSGRDLTAGRDAAAAREALHLTVTGRIQGVGFRPFVYRLARRHDLAGWVRNTAGDVEIEVEGSAAHVEAFLQELGREAPALARVEQVLTQPAPGSGAVGFAIVPSTNRSNHRPPVLPDVGMCDACAAELLDPGNRRYRYPFITCTDCGPRFSLIEAMPYDRERTSMRAFQPCPQCEREYGTPGDRRHHSQTNSCPACGPRLRYLATDRASPAEGEAALYAAAADLRRGLIVALRGVGGFHLAVDATDDAAVRRLRERKHRRAKPFAVMVGTGEDARDLAEVGDVEAGLLTSAERPIVLLAARRTAGLARSVAPGLATLGLMTAYSPLHRLLLDMLGRPLVMTSGNRADEPLAATNDEALARLAGIADGFLLHDREIVVRCDDSVTRVSDGAPVLLRRARGYAPLPVALPIETPVPLVAVGAHLKNTFTLAQGRDAYVSPHLGDLETLETLEHFETLLERYGRLFRIEPVVAVRDRHPGYLSSRLAEELGLHRILAVQHHHAHVAAVAAEYGVTRRVVGLAFDGTGYGDDGHVWGAEALVADLAGFERVGQLRYAPLPGGDLAVRQPWRSALGYLSLAPEAEPAFAHAFVGVSERERALALSQIHRHVNTPLASSMGRLFDAAAAILGIRRVTAYEAQAAMELEALAGTRPARALPFPILDLPGGRWLLDPLPLLVALGERRRAGHDVAELAAAFHESVADAAAGLADRACAAAGTELVVLSGGVFQNARLLAAVAQRLEVRLLQTLAPRQLSPNDEAISYGQAAVAAALLGREQ
ncbi:MAG TPA: carbamoyltransferase HypF [Gemmatimonadales bacterium]